VDNLLVPVAASATHVGFCAIRTEPILAALGEAAGMAARIAMERKCSVHRVPVDELQKRLHEAGAATIYVSDVLPGDPDFELVQWWATAGGLHGLVEKPSASGERGKKIHGQYFEAFPNHAAELGRVLDGKTAERWKVVAEELGVPSAKQPPMAPGMKRGEWLRALARVER
jgi:hypothetical protein